ncbi:MAG: peptide chain release factor N(5)-glutamine methyltransferase [Lachnospiraceae bacterium]|nr:peptide chain release factor N(5)-glutamine methyltransferase [Lachnospiraceae bacterium]MBP3578204.1 peptide chain release factor N(5)-glutamine methyltransferase [Lachnospiraceae bacterium]
MITCKEALGQVVNMLVVAGVPDADIDAWYLFEYVTGMSRSSYFLHKEEEIEQEQAATLVKLAEQRAKRVPLQYITGSQEFMGYSFLVSPATLIPRQDTEILVEEVSREANGKRVLDLCTGTGCILLSLAKMCHLPDAVGTDISAEAIETAKSNATRLDAIAEFYCGDLFDAVPTGRCFDIIVSNPPYIPSAVIETLMPEVKEHEPMSALDGDEDGLFFYRKIIHEANKFLANQGRIFFEIGCEQGEDVSLLLRENGFQNIRVIKDLAGLDRVVSATLVK